MPELTKELIAKIEETHDKVNRIDVVLNDENQGLCKTVKEQGKRIHLIELILAASGIAGASILAIIKAIGA